MKSIIGTFAYGLGAALFAPSITAAVVSTPTVTIVQVDAFGEFGSGDVIFTTSTLVSGCDGFWLRPSDPGFKTLYAMLTTANAAKTTVQVFAHNDSIWTGSGSPFCRVYAIRAS